MKTITMAACAAYALAALLTMPARAQQAGGGETLNAPYTTRTGETVPNPGKSQSGGTTPLDRRIQREDDKIDSGICKGC